MSELGNVSNRRVLDTGQVCYMALMLWFMVLSLDGRSALVPKSQACNYTDMMNMSQTCMCTFGTVVCTGMYPKLLSVPTSIGKMVRILDVSGNSIQRLEENDFHGLDRLQQMALQDNDISDIHQNSFRGMFKLEILFLEKNNISRIQADTFKDLLELKYLNLSSNAIQRIEEQDFKDLKQMSILALQDNEISYIHQNAFSNLTKLVILFLEKNKISRLNPNGFQDLLELKYLNLSSNLLQGIEEHDFSGLQQIEILALQNNEISFIHQNAFRNMSKLEILYLENNRLGELDPSGRTFQHLSALRRLDLSANSIQRIEEDNFAGLDHVQSLYLQNNKISYIHQQALKNLVRLEILYLEGNRLELDLSGITFQNLSALKELDLSANSFQTISENAFIGLRHVQRIYLQDNKISYVHSNAFKNLQQLEILYLERNRLSELDPSGHIFLDLSALHQLDLSANKIHRIEQNNFLGLGHIKKIFLHNNAITYMHPDAFKNLFHLETLNLENNRLGELDPSGRTFQHLSSLQKLCLGNNSISTVNKYSFLTMVASGNTVSVNMDHNPIHCDCNVWAIRAWEMSLPADRIEFLNLKCANDDHKRTYKEVEESVFGSCNSSYDDVFAEKIACPSCEGHRTNQGCKLMGETNCYGEMVCHKTMKWEASQEALLVASYCDSYQSCLTSEDSNKETCVIDSQKSPLDCHFCCRGSTCTEDSIGGRTKDFTYALSYIRNDTYQSFMADTEDPLYLQEKEKIETGVRNAVQSLIGGFDVHLLQIIAQQNQQYQVVLRLEVTTFNTKTEESVENDIKNSLQDADSFFFDENIIKDSFTVSLYMKGQCTESFTHSLNMGNITWKASPLGIQKELCPYNSSLNPELAYASRTCLRTINGSVFWGDVDYSSCASKNDQDNPDPEKIFNVSVSAKNAQAVSTILKDYTEDLNFTTDKVNKMMAPLEMLINETILEQPEVIQNVVDSISNLINIDEKTLLDLEPTTSISKRLLTIIDDISMKAPLTEGKLVVVTPNLAIAAQEVNPTKPQDVVLTVSGPNGSMVSVGFFNENDSQLTGKSSMVIPMQAIVLTMTPKEKESVSRISFAVHQSDKLFNPLGNRESREVPQANVTENDFCETNNSYNCSRKSHHPFITMINSNIITASVPGVEVQNLTENVTMTFRHKNNNATNGRCVFWKTYSSSDTGEWSDEGCGIVNSSSHETTCACNHLTNFALFMDVYQEGGNLSELDRKILSIISYVGCGISLCALLVTLLSYSVLRKLRGDNPSKILMNLCLAMMLSNLVYLVGMHEYTFDNTVSCKVVSVLLHYFLLSSLSWMAVEAFYMYLALVLVFKTHFNNFILKCSLVGWGVPLVIVIITLGISATENYGFINSGLCWLRNPAFYAAFVGPVCLILLINCLAFGLVVKQLVGISSSKLTKMDRNRTIQHLRAAVGVVILLGLTWLFAIFAIGQASVAFYYLFAVFNSLQGLFIFIYYCLLKKDVIATWKSLLPCFEVLSEEMTKSTSASRAMTGLASTHHLIKHDCHSKSETSTFFGNTACVASTTADLAYSTVKKNIPNGSSEECESPVTTETLAATADSKENSPPLLSETGNQDFTLADTADSKENSPPLLSETGNQDFTLAAIADSKENSPPLLSETGNQDFTLAATADSKENSPPLLTETGNQDFTLAATADSKENSPPLLTETGNQDFTLAATADSKENSPPLLTETGNQDFTHLESPEKDQACSSHQE